MQDSEQEIILSNEGKGINMNVINAWQEEDCNHAIDAILQEPDVDKV